MSKGKLHYEYNATTKTEELAFRPACPIWSPECHDYIAEVVFNDIEEAIEEFGHKTVENAMLGKPQTVVYQR